MTDKKQQYVESVRKLVNDIEKNFGKGALMRLGDGAVPEPVAVIPTGSLALDEALGRHEPRCIS